MLQRFLSRSSIRPHAPRRSIAALLLAAALASSSLVVAAPSSFGKADTVWHQGDLDGAMSLYEEALNAGGLEPKEVVIAYSRIGTVKAAMRDEQGALSAFRTAATIDPEFVLPADSGPLAKKLYEKARKEAAALGDFLSVSLSTQESVPAKQDFNVVTVVPEAYVALVTEMSLEVQDVATGKKWRQSKPIAAQNEFTVPKRVVIAGATLKVTARAIDDKKNAWAVAEQKVKVEGGKAKPAAMDGGEVSPFEPTPTEERRAEQEERQKRDKGFMQGPWPWVIGGGVLVVATVATIFVVAGGSSEASVGAPSWQR